MGPVLYHCATTTALKKNLLLIPRLTTHNFFCLSEDTEKKKQLKDNGKGEKASCTKDGIKYRRTSYFILGRVL